MFKNKINVSYFKNDLPAGLVVWLVALPLCLGIAQGCEADPFAGIISGIIGGLVVTLFSGSRFGVSGPAAGLITIVVTAIHDLGYEAFLLAVVLSGVIQFLLGLFRLGVVGYFIPTSVINGMLAAIGITLILKQIPHALGVDSDPEGEMSFEQVDGENTFSEIFLSFDKFALGALLIFLISIIILLVWELPVVKKNNKLKLIPASLLVVVVGSLLNQLFGSVGGNFGEMTFLGSSHLVNLPDALSTGDYKNLLESKISKKETVIIDKTEKLFKDDIANKAAENISFEGKQIPITKEQIVQSVKEAAKTTKRKFIIKVKSS